jgi:hypothetical protein
MANDAHLHNAAATLQAILNAKHPEHTWIVEVRPRKHEELCDEAAPASDRREPPDDEPS